MTRPLKILFLLPFAPDLRGIHGGSRATAAIIDMLSQHHGIRVLYLAGPGDSSPRELPRNCEALSAVPMESRTGARRSMIWRRLSAARKLMWGSPQWVEECWSPVMADQAAAVAAQFEPDVVHYEFHVMAQYMRSVRSACPAHVAIVTEHEPGITADAVWGAPRTLRQRLRRLSSWRAWSRYERRVLPMADAIIVFTQSDEVALQHLLGPSAPPISVIPLQLPGIELVAGAVSPSVRSDFVFVGNFRHPPNADAARRLVQSIFGMISSDFPEATLTVVGPDPPDDVVDAASDGITVTGWVDDSSIYLAGAKVVLVPLRQGGGLRVKMLEACAAGKAIVASPVAVEGLSIRHGKEVMIARTDEEFAERATALLADPEARARLERASRAWWEEEHDVSRWSAQYAELYRSLNKAR